MSDWTFFSNYGHVLVCLARNRDARLRDVAQEVGITERAVQKIVRDLQDGGYVEVTKQGRCNRYRINRRKSLRHPLQSQTTVGKLLALVTPGGRVDTEGVPPPEHAEPVRADTPPAAVGQPDEPGPGSRPRAKPAPHAPAVAAARPDGSAEESAGEPGEQPGESPDDTPGGETRDSAGDSGSEKSAGSEDKPDAESQKKRGKKPSPGDSREQGSLF